MQQHSQAASPSWPIEICHTIDAMLSLLMGVDWEVRIALSHFHEFKFSLVCKFILYQEFGLFQEFYKNPRILDFRVL